MSGRPRRALLLGLSTGAAGGPPDFKLKDLEGKTFRLADHLGKEVVYITFWATWCVPCRRELPEIQKLYDELGAKGFLAVAVNTDPASAESQVKPWVKQHKLTFPFVLDPDNNVLDKFNPSRALPTGACRPPGQRVQDYAGYKTGDELLLKEEILKLLAAGAPAGAAPSGASAAAPGAGGDA